jgi:hypothetical protein
MMKKDERLLHPVHLFKAYAKTVAPESGFPVIGSYHETRYRLLCGLFDMDLNRDLGWSTLAESYNQAARFNPSAGIILGTDGINNLPGFPRALRALRRHAVAMRRIYAGLAVDRLLKEYPHLGSYRVSARRLARLTALGKAPDVTDECIKFLDSDEEPPIEDDVPTGTMDELKRAEENRFRAEQHRQKEEDTVIARALAAGIGTPETVRHFIYDMDVLDFLRLAEGCTRLSRVDFKPGLTE